MHLTDLAIRKLPLSENGQKTYRDDVLRGFGVRCSTRAKTFVVMYGEDRRLKTIGRFPDIGLAEARKEAMKILAAKPKTVRTRKLGDVRSAYLQDVQGRLRHNTFRSYKHLLSGVGVTYLEDVKRHHIDLKKPHAISAWKVFFNWCIKHEYTDRNPFAHIPVKHGQRDRVLNDDELRAVWNYEFEPFSSIVKLLILTGQRRSEVAAFNLDWVEDGVVRIPAENTKNGRVHIFPVSDQIIDLIKSYPENTFNGWTNGKKRLDRVVPLADWTLHDLRRTFATNHAKIGTPIHVTERLLNHVSGTISGVAAIYNRHSYLNEMQAASLAYETYIAEIISKDTAS